MNEEKLQRLRQTYDNMGRRELAILLLTNFAEYCKWIHFMANGTEYDMTEYHLAICKKLQERATNSIVPKKRNLGICVPPGFGKSLLVQYYISWVFARNKQSMFCYVAYGEKLIKKLSREVRNLLMMPEWEELFGHEMDPGDKSVLNFHLISGGVRSGLTAGTISSAILGLDAGNPASRQEYSGDLILDDINSPEVATSLHEQLETPEIYQRKLATRRRTPRTGTICIMQRHHKNDFIGWAEEHEEEDWEILSYPAITESGESFYESRFPIAELRKIEKRNPYLFASMYMQNPLKAEGSIFKREWLRFYDAYPNKLKKVFITTDTAFTENGDWSVICCWGLADDNNLYLLRMIRGRWLAPDVKTQIVRFFEQCNATWKICRRVYIENTLSGLGMMQDLRRLCPTMAIVPLKRGAKKSKMSRVDSASTWLEAGRVFFRNNHPNNPAIVSELMAYNPEDKNPQDDFIDNLGDACEIAFNTSVGSINI